VQPTAPDGIPTDVPVGDQTTLVPPAAPPSYDLTNPASLVGLTFDDYRLLEVIGQGGMGVVYKARQLSLERDVAIKMLLPGPLASPVLLARFLAEARAAAGLSHPNIMPVYQLGKWPLGHYFSMQYVEGETVASILARRAVPPSWAASVLTVVSAAVHYAHERGIVHRDLKPANLMIDRARRPVVMDFGIAKCLGSKAGLTEHGVVVGTPAYMPPEQAGEDPSRVGPHSDVYSLGAILFACLTGRPPFQGATNLETILRVIAPDPAPAARSLRPDVPEALDRICARCLSKNPADRYPSAKALARDLKGFLGGAAGAGPAAPESLRGALPSVALVSQETGKVVRLFAATTLVGRAPECDLVLRVPDVSKRHCQILLSPDRVVVEDLGSANGTAVNGRPVGRARLHDGDQLDIAGHVFVVRLEPRRAAP
jgi:serine/threonine protein kinase